MPAARRLPVTILGGVLALLTPAAAAGPAGPTRPPDDPEVVRWEADVARLEALDAAVADPTDAVLFIGSSSIRLWDTIAADMAPYATIRRGYGGARYRDLCHFAARLVAAHDCRAVVVFVANDITSPTGPEVEDVMRDVRATHAAIRRHHPEPPILFVAVTPTESRWKAWPVISRFNDAIAEFCAAEEATFFVPTAERFLDAVTGRPRPELFQDDELHLSPDGYEVWAGVITSALDDVLAEIPAGGR